MHAESIDLKKKIIKKKNSAYVHTGVKGMMR